MQGLQQTIARPIQFRGIGVHSGKEVRVSIMPAIEDTGIVFKRTDLTGDNMIRASYENVVDTRLCTVIANEAGARVSTIEHIMAALWGCDIDNAIICINDEEMAIMDGSAAPVVALIKTVGVKTQHSPRAILKITKPIKVEIEDKFIELSPANGLIVDYTIEFAHPAIGKQSFVYDASKHSFNHIISRARTFGFVSEVEQLQKAGLARGASLTNAIGIDDNGVMNPEGLRYNDEFVRHKLLDFIGDCFLARHRIQGRVVCYRGGHALHNLLLRQLFSEPDNFTIDIAEETRKTATL